MFHDTPPEIKIDTDLIPPLPRWVWMDLVHWMRLLWPVALVLVCGAIFFQDAVIATILATPHPALVYSIFGVCTVAIVSAMIVLRGYLHESKYARRWMKLSHAMRVKALKVEAKRSVFMPVYALLTDIKNFSPESRQAAVTAELEAGEVALQQRLEFPHFLGGALVGMGLIGTFVGLLGTLEDLSKVFTALVNTNSTTMSPTEMFSDMVTKLQAPMKGMGTAFVASLYGLLGSLIVTLMMVSVRKTAASSMRQIHIVVRQLGYGAHGGDKLTPMANIEFQQETLRWLKVLQNMVEDLSQQADSQKVQQDHIIKQNAYLMEDLMGSVQATQASQKRTEEGLQMQLSAMRTTMQQDADDRAAVMSGQRQDMHQLVRSLETCRSSFEESARSLRSVLAAQDTRPER